MEPVAPAAQHGERPVRTAIGGRLASLSLAGIETVDAPAEPALPHGRGVAAYPSMASSIEILRPGETTPLDPTHRIVDVLA